MSNTIRARLGVSGVAGLFVTALAALSGCATLHGQDAVTEQLLAKAGFREVGTYRRHAKLDGRWRDTVIVERLIGEAAR